LVPGPFFVPYRRSRDQWRIPVNVVILGGGVIGGAIAYYLSRKGLPATVIERCDIACAASGKSGGFLARDWCVGQLQEPLALLSFDLHTDLPGELSQDYGYRRVDTYHVALSDRRTITGDCSTRSGDWIDGNAAVQQQLGDTTTTAQLDPGKFTRALINQACDNGAIVRFGTVEAIEFDQVQQRVTGVVVDNERIPADAVVIAMGPWSILATQWLALPAVYGLKGYSITLAPSGPVAPEALFLDYEDAEGERHGPELVPRADGEVYLCGFSGSQPLPLAPEDISVDGAECDRLRQLAGRISSTLTEATVTRQQACYRPICEDAMPLIGPVPGAPGAFIATGHNCWGMLNAPGTGLAMAELIADGQSRTLDLGHLTPGRLPSHHFGS